MKEITAEHEHEIVLNRMKREGASMSEMSRHADELRCQGFDVRTVQGDHRLTWYWWVGPDRLANPPKRIEPATGWELRD